MPRGIRFNIIVVSVACLVLTPFAVMALRGSAWWRYLVAIVGLNFLVLFLGAQAGQKLIALGRRKSPAVGIITRFLVVVDFIFLWLVLWTFVAAPSLEVAFERLHKLLRLEVLFPLAAVGVIVAIPFPFGGWIRRR
jgi:hypothetical protein